VGSFGDNVRLEVERSLTPREQEIHRFLNLHADGDVKLLLRERFLFNKKLAEPFVTPALLERHRGIELCLRDEPVLDEQIAQPVAPIDDRRVRNASFVEVDVPEACAIGDAQTSALLAHRKKLQNVWKAGFLEAAANRHLCGSRNAGVRHRFSSIMRVEASGHCQTIFSRSRKYVS